MAEGLPVLTGLSLSFASLCLGFPQWLERRRYLLEPGTWTTGQRRNWLGLESDTGNGGRAASYSARTRKVGEAVLGGAEVCWLLKTSES